MYEANEDFESFEKFSKKSPFKTRAVRPLKEGDREIRDARKNKDKVKQTILEEVAAEE